MLQIYGGSGHGRVIADAYLLNQPANTIESYDDGKSMDRLIPHFGRNKEIDHALIVKGRIPILDRIFSALRFNNTLLPLLGNKFYPSYSVKYYHGYDPIYMSKIDFEIMFSQEFMLSFK